MTVQSEVKNPLLHKIEIGTEGGFKRGQTQVEDVLAQKAQMAAARYNAAELEKMALESENEASKLRGEPPVHRPVNDDPDKLTKADLAKKEQQQKNLIETGKMLLDSGLDPKQVGQILMGLAPLPNGSVMAPAQQGLGVDDVLTIVDRITSASQHAQADDITSRLEKRINDLERELSLEKRVNAMNTGANVANLTKPMSPTEVVRQQISALKEFADAAIAMGFAAKPGASGSADIEVVRENNRHAEAEAEIGIEKIRVSNEKEHGEKMANILGNGLERVGSGIAQQIRKGAGVTSGRVGFSSLKCDDCGTDILITPTSGDKVKCPKCGAEYENTDAKKATNDKTA